MQKAEILKTIETNLRRFDDPLSRMISSERSWPGLHRFVNTDEDGFDELDEVVEELVTHTTARVSTH